VSVLLPEPGPQPAPAPDTIPAPAGEDRDAAEAARRLDAARERLRREIPPAES
jgi:hypothetical protein